MAGRAFRQKERCPRANRGDHAYPDEDARFAQRQAFGLDDIDGTIPYVEYTAKTLFLVWVTLTEQKWVTFGERRGASVKKSSLPP